MIDEFGYADLDADDESCFFDESGELIDNDIVDILQNTFISSDNISDGLDQDNFEEDDDEDKEDFENL